MGRNQKRLEKLLGVKAVNKYKFVLFLVIGAVFLLIYLFNERVDNNKVEQHDGYGTITRILPDENGRTWYYVDINIDGRIYSAQTDTYQRVPDDVDEGDVVSVKYRFAKDGAVLCYITQDGFERVIRDERNKKPIMLYLSIACFLIFLFMLIKTLLKI